MAPEKLSSLRTKAAVSVQSLRTDEGLKVLRYEETTPAKPPIPVTIAPPRVPPVDTHPALRSSPGRIDKLDQSKRDSGLAPTESTARSGSLIAGDEYCSIAPTNSASIHMSGLAIPETPKTPRVLKSENSSISSRWRRGSGMRDRNPKTPESEKRNAMGSDGGFSRITTPIPTDGELELDFMDDIAFSKRGSVLLGGKKALNGRHRPEFIGRQPTLSMLATSTYNSSLSEELERESQKVRSMYEIGQSTDWRNGRVSTIGNHNSLDEEEETIDEPEVVDGTQSYLSPKLRPDSSFSLGRSSVVKTEYELAGGIEDWKDVEGGDVDRYGFIVLQRDTTNRSSTPEPRPPQRVSTVLQLASQAPRKRRGIGRPLSSAQSSRSVPHRTASRKVSSRSLNTQDTVSSQPTSSRSQAFRSAANRLPGNRDRRWMYEAGDMLTLPPGLADVAEEEEGGRAAEDAKRKEWDRTEKWRKMAKVVKTGSDGQGMEFEFDVRNPKLIERTWKGIPDRWRAAAWHSFLSASAKKRKGSATDAEIVKEFYNLLERSSADDVQIDMDVPRTINSHIMFRRRYRGGQRLLFRVLHSLSLYFPDTGYAQGMASLAATLLCYYDEERTFVMLVRMWQVRGMDKLYESGFPGLMAALDEFQMDWMNGHDVSKRLVRIDFLPLSLLHHANNVHRMISPLSPPPTAHDGT
jgi:hypothetical protein